MPKSVSFQRRALARFLTVALCVGFCFSLGCARSESSKPETTGSKDEAKSLVQPTTEDKIAGSYSAETLTGIWLGTTTLNEAKLSQKLERLAPAQQQLALAKAKSFLSTLMAIEYKNDGTLENDLELVSVDGQILRDGSSGVWKVIESRNDGLMIETQETLPDGTIATGSSFFQFFEGGNRFVAEVPVGDDLDGCEARLVFERQVLAAANLAEENSETQNK